MFPCGCPTKPTLVLFIEMFANLRNRDSEILSFTIPRNQELFIKIQSVGKTRNSAIEEIKKVFVHIEKKHEKIMREVRERRELEINNLDILIKNMKQRELVLLQEKVRSQKISITNFNQELKYIKKDIISLSDKNPVLAALKLTEKQNLMKLIRSLELDLLELKNKKYMLETTEFNKLIEQRSYLASLLKRPNYKKTEIIGEILVKKNITFSRLLSMMGISFLLSLTFGYLIFIKTKEPV